MQRAWDAMPDWFEVLPQAPCAVQPTTTGAKAFYFPPAGDGSRGGTFFVNVADPTSWGTFELESMAFHEGIPGHHLQLAIASELSDVPEFRKHIHNAAYAEGWGLYTERLSDEMGLYSSAVDRMGMLSADSMRACRLVVDTGLHALGWSREQAVDYMVANSPLAEGVVRPEIDRYIVSPGQATLLHGRPAGDPADARRGRAAAGERLRRQASSTRPCSTRDPSRSACSTAWFAPGSRRRLHREARSSWVGSFHAGGRQSVGRGGRRSVAGPTARAGRSQGGSSDRARAAGQCGLRSTGDRRGHDHDGAGGGVHDAVSEQRRHRRLRGASITRRSASRACSSSPRRLPPRTTRISTPWSAPSTSATSRSSWACWSACSCAGSCGMREEVPAGARREVGWLVDAYRDHATAVRLGLCVRPHQGGGGMDVALTPTTTV